MQDTLYATGSLTDFPDKLGRQLVSGMLPPRDLAFAGLQPFRPFTQDAQARTPITLNSIMHTCLSLTQTCVLRLSMHDSMLLPAAGTALGI